MKCNLIGATKLLEFYYKPSSGLSGSIPYITCRHCLAHNDKDIIDVMDLPVLPPIGYHMKGFKITNANIIDENTVNLETDYIVNPNSEVDLDSVKKVLVDLGGEVLEDFMFQRITTEEKEIFLKHYNEIRSAIENSPF
jgi:hypothetical protein